MDIKCTLDFQKNKLSLSGSKSTWGFRAKIQIRGEFLPSVAYIKYSLGSKEKH